LKDGLITGVEGIEHHIALDEGEEGRAEDGLHLEVQGEGQVAPVDHAANGELVNGRNAHRSGLFGTERCGQHQQTDECKKCVLHDTPPK
jgi:hypothetical protein